MNVETCRKIDQEKLLELRQFVSENKFVSNIRTEEMMFRALSDGKRLLLIHLLEKMELCVCDISAITDSPQPTVSNEIKELFRSGLLNRRKDGRWIYYKTSAIGSKNLKGSLNE